MQLLRSWIRGLLSQPSAVHAAALLGAIACSTSGSTGTDPGSDGGPGGGDGGDRGSGATSCAAGNSLALQSLGSDAPDGTGTPETVITINNVGTSGTYPRVTSMNPGTFGQTCPADAC